MASVKTCVLAFFAVAIMASPAFAYHRHSPTRHFMQPREQTFVSLPHAKARPIERRQSFVQNETPRHHGRLVLRLAQGEPRPSQSGVAWMTASRTQPMGAMARESSDAITTVPHPAGCPASAYCGCGASVQVFGHPVRDLWLAANWLKFPPAAPAAGMAAVRAHHVVVIMQMRSGNRAVVYDANSGGGQTHIHEMSLSGYSIRNPHAG